MELEEAIEKTKALLNLNDILFEETGTHLYLGNQEKELIQILLNHITKQEKMIELMVEKYNDDFGDIGDFCQHEYCSKDYNCKECIKQYFEKKAEEELQ